MTTITTTTPNTTNTSAKFSAAEFLAQVQTILRQLISSTFGSVDKPQSKESIERFALDVEAAVTTLCVEKGITEDEATEQQQLRYSSTMLVPILLTVFFAGQEPNLDTNTKAFINLMSNEKGDIPKLVQQCNSRLDSGACFLRAGDCQGEVYLLPNGGVFKPEVTKCSTSRLRNGIEDNGEHLREIAAFKVDNAYGGFARVPPTAAVTVLADSLPDRDDDFEDTLSGSLQKWVSSVCASEDMGSSRFNVNDVHHIGILDILLYNTDRHGGNILVTQSGGCGTGCGKGNARLVPIDHGLCLPDFRHLDQAEFEWLYWKQAQQKFTKHDLELIASFNGDKVAGILSDLGFSSGSVLTARIMVAVLQHAALKRGWSLRKIGEFCTKHFTAKSSALADIVSTTMATASMQDRESTFADHAIFIDLFRENLVKHFDGGIAV